MALVTYRNVGISALAAAVPERVVDNYKYDLDIFPEEDVRKIVDKIGIFERRFADENTCSSDLCYAAAEQLFRDNDVDRTEIDLLVFLSQTPDYRMPATCYLLQERLGLNKSCIAFDVNLGCAGFEYALSIVYAFMEKMDLRKALLLDGETRSKVYSPKDRRAAFLFGDAGVAALIERDEKFGESYFSLNSDGSKAELIMIPAGGYRKMSTPESLKEHIIDEYGNARTDEQAFMKGADVFNFVIVEVPKDIRRLLTSTGEDIQAFDYYVFHQANTFINDYLIKKLKLDREKVPWSIHKFGNTSSVSVPLTIVSELKYKMAGRKRLLLSAFGVGMAWATASVPFVDCKISDIVEVANGQVVQKNQCYE